MNKAYLIIVLVLVVSAGMFYGCKSKQPADKPETTKKAPAFELTGHDGKTTRLADHKGRIVVLEWFNYDCPFVKYHYEQAGTMIDLAAKYKDKNVVWLAVNSTNSLTTEKIKAFAEKHKLPFPILDDRSGKTGRAFEARTTPHMFVIDTKGQIVYSGAIDNSQLGRRKEGVINYVDKALAELISGKPVEISTTEPYGCSVKYADAL